MKVPQTAKNRVAILFSHAILGHTSRQKYSWKRYMHPLFRVDIFMIAKTWKQPKCPLTEEWIKEMTHKYTTEYYSAIRERMK